VSAPRDGHAPLDGDPSAGALRRWTRLLLGAGLLWVVVFVAIPAAQRLPGMAPAVQALLDSGIETGAIFYTGVEKVAQAEAAVHGVARRPPR
jgi:hypothetical protein